MFTHAPPPDLPDLKCITENGSRKYVTPTGERYPSVTTVTGWSKRQFFAEWRRKHPEESKQILEKGNKFHTIIEDYLNNKGGPDEDTAFVMSHARARDLFYQLQPELDRIDNIRVQEIALWSDMMGLAGRVDCIAEFDGKLSVIDFKSSKRKKREEDIENYFQQATAYAIMWKELLGETIDNIVILVSSDDGKTQVIQRNPVNHVAGLKECIDIYHTANNSEPYREVMGD
tara:strand:- start:297 stop:986 length:690 start_codon:yes stop_codon:yes gene_type:complete